MRVVQIMPEFGLGGAEIMCESLAKELVAQGIELTIISLYRYKSVITERIEKTGIELVYLDKKPGLDFSMIFKIYSELKRVKADVIHTHRYVMQYAVPAAILAGVPIRVHTFHSVAQKENTKAARIVNNLFFKYAGVIPVALSQNVKNTIIDEYRNYKGEIPVIINGVDLKKCIVKKNYAFSNQISILHVGRFTEAKNHSELLCAFSILLKEYPNMKLRLVGDGELRDKVINKIRELKIEDRVELYGTTGNVFPLMNEADIFVLPSIYEGMPMTLIEAMGTGLPIVASRVGGIPDMIKDEAEGLLCDPTADSIAKTIGRYIENISLRELLGKNAKEKSEEYSSERMCEGYIKLYGRNEIR